MKYFFKNDYAEGCHPRILEALQKTNLQQENGYGLDGFCLKAEQLIQEKINSKSSKVHFVSGGTQANLIVISAFLRPHESVISAKTGHIFNNEAGAIEATGHKINSIITSNGKLIPIDIQELINEHQNIPHQVKPKLVYISNSTEIGTVYSKAELKSLWDFCKANQLFLFMDGARLGQALASEINDLTLEDIAQFTDAFYLGGTKNGMLLGEAIVINNPELQKEFGYHIKQKGGMLAKGRLMGIQFYELLRDNLYFELAQKANNHAMRLKAAFTENGFEFLSETCTNQIFPILSNLEIERLSEQFEFYVWQKISETESSIRIITSWATRDIAVSKFIEEINALKRE